jgi:type II secretory pathway pseudopilin PulG
MTPEERARDFIQRELAMTGPNDMDIWVPILVQLIREAEDDLLEVVLRDIDQQIEIARTDSDQAKTATEKAGAAATYVTLTTLRDIVAFNGWRGE